MAAKPIRLVYVGDDELHFGRALSRLTKLPEFEFTVVKALGEDAALEALASKPDLVVLESRLPQGDCYSCIKRLRETDSVVPVIVLTNRSAPKLAAELLEAGADDQFSADSLDAAPFAASVQAALARASAWRRRTADAVHA